MGEGSRCNAILPSNNIEGASECAEVGIVCSANAMLFFFFFPFELEVNPAIPNACYMQLASVYVHVWRYTCEYNP